MSKITRLFVHRLEHLARREARRNALRNGLLRYQGGRGWSKPIATIPMNDGEWRARLASPPE